MERSRSLVHGRPERARRAGRLLVLGALVVWIAAFTPTAVAVYTPPGATAAEMLPEILERPVGWQLAHLLFLSGIVITAAGLLVLVRLFDLPTPRTFGLVGVVINVGGVLTWAVAVYFRVTLPSHAMVDAGAAAPLFVAAMTGWIYQLYSGLTLTSFAAVGAALITSGSMIRFGVYAVVASGLVAAVFVAVGDMPLLVHYIITAPIGISLMRQASRQGNTPGTGETT